MTSRDYSRKGRRNKVFMWFIAASFGFLEPSASAVDVRDLSIKIKDLSFEYQRFLSRRQALVFLLIKPQSSIILIMEVALTWNLVILSVFVLLFAYSFMLGQDDTIKLILCIYIAILTADGVAGVLQQFVVDPSPGFQALMADKRTQIMAWIRMGLFIVAVVIFAVKSGFHVLLDKHQKATVRFAIHSWFSAMSALLFLSTMLIYLSGNSFVEGMLFAKDISIYEQSLLAQILIDYYQLWFSLPAMSFLVTSFLFEKTDHI